MKNRVCEVLGIKNPIILENLKDTKDLFEKMNIQVMNGTQLSVGNTFQYLDCKFSTINDLTVNERLKKKNMLILSFCLGASLEWSLEEISYKSWEIESMESFAMTGETNQCKSRYHKEELYHGIGISFDKTKLISVAEHLRCEKALNDINSMQTSMRKYMITPRVLALLKQIEECQMSGTIKNLYLEGKFLEILAVYMDEMVCIQTSQHQETSLSKEDLYALKRAKECIDKTFIQPLTLTQLSRKVYLNEYKLKSGFKQCFGQTVYSYVMDKRMEYARILLEKKQYRVSDVAGMVGYANTSHFITAYAKKYNTTPGEFMKQK
jgi:AraC-like DNA-binding protein